jgi:hypothetical protein
VILGEKGMLRTILAGLALLIALPLAARAQDWIYIYENGVPVGHLVGDDFEFYYVDPADIAQANKELMGELTGYGPHQATVGVGTAQDKSGTAQAAEHYKPRPDGVQVSGVSIRDYLSPGDWQAIYGDYSSNRSWYTELDKSGVHWSWDSTSFNTAGHVYGLDANDDSSPKYLRGDRERYMTDFTWRRGTMDGSALRVSGLTYETNFRNGGDQPVDVKLKRVQSDFRAVEHGYTVQGAVFGGKYVSQRLGMNNSFTGGQLDAGHWLSPNVGIFADGTLTAYDIGGTDAGVNRANWGGSIDFQARGLTLSGYTRSFVEDSDLTANSHTRGYDDLGARLEYRPAGYAYVSAGYRKRKVDIERLRIEDPNLYDHLYADPPATRTDLASFREPLSASGDRFDAQTRLKLTDQLYFGANYAKDEWDELPIAGLLIGTTQDSYFADQRTQKSAQLTYDMRCNGRITLRSEELERDNGPRESNFSRTCQALNYSGSLCRTARWGAGVSRTKTSLDLSGITQDWSGDSWNYDFSLAGQGGIGDYRLSYRKHLIDGATGGDYDSLGLELKLKDVPLSVSAWWRERQEALGGAANFDDAGLSLGYYISVR